MSDVLRAGNKELIFLTIGAGVLGSSSRTSRRGLGSGGVGREFQIRLGQGTVNYPSMMDAIPAGKPATDSMPTDNAVALDDIHWQDTG